MSLALLLCVEAGRLESQACLLVESLRTFGGPRADLPVHAFAPRPGHGPSDDTAARLAELGVTLHREALNRDFPDYPIGNKIFVCAEAERQLDAEVLVFADSDTIFTGCPDELDLPADVDAAARPVDRRNRGSTGPGDPADEYWTTLATLLSVPGAPMVRTVVEDEPIRAYFNAGLVAARRRAGVFAEWEADFRRLMAAGHVPRSGVLNNMDQLALAGTLGRRFERVRILSDRYNYPLGKRPLLAAPLGDCQLADLVHVHYHRWFHRRDFLGLTRPRLAAEDPVVHWLASRLPLEPTIDDPVRYLDARS